jgi:hypothetical protein
MGLTQVDAGGVQLAASMDEVASPETYLGYERAENFTSIPKPCTTGRPRIWSHKSPG